MTNCFHRTVADDPTKLVEACLDPESGAHRFFRMSGAVMQGRFAEIVAHGSIPRILIHGNPHIANYCKTKRGAAMVDFDRSRVGPYAYDLVRFLISVALCRTNKTEEFLHPIILDQFRRGYLFGHRAKLDGYEEMKQLRDKHAKRWQLTTKAYLQQGKKWARRLKLYRVNLKKKHRHLLGDYLANRGESHIAETFKIANIAEVPGSMGKMHYVYHLVHRQGVEDSILIDIKETYVEQDTEWYENPFDHQGVRMNRVAELYAPGWEQRPGHASWKGQDYWGRQIPLQQIKPESLLTELEQCDLCFSVASQLGWGHARAAKKSERAAIRADFVARWDEYVESARQMYEEILAAHGDYMRQAETLFELDVAGNC